MLYEMQFDLNGVAADRYEKLAPAQRDVLNAALRDSCPELLSLLLGMTLRDIGKSRQ